MKNCKFFIGDSKTALSYEEMRSYLFNNPGVVDGTVTELPQMSRTSEPSGKEVKRRGVDETIENYSAHQVLRDIIAANRQYYEVEHDDEAVQKARTFIERNGVGNTYMMVTSGGAVSDAKGGPRLENESIQTIRMMLINTYSEALADAMDAGDTIAASEISLKITRLIEVTNKAATLFGREGARMNMWKLQNPYSVVYKYEKEIDEANKQEAVKQGVDLDTAQKLAEELQKIALELQNMKAALAQQVDKNERLLATVDRLSKQKVDPVTGDPPGTVPGGQTGTAPSGKRKAPRKNRVTEEQKESALARRNAALAKLKSSNRGPGGLNVSASISGWSQDDIEALGELALSFAEEGYFSRAAITEAVYNLYVNEAGFAGTIEEIAEVLDETGAWKTEQRKQLEKKYKSESKGLMTEIKKIIVEHTSGDQINDLKGSLTRRLQEELGLDAEDAQAIADIVQNDIDTKLKKAATAKIDKALGNNKMPDSPKAKKQTLLDDLTNLLLSSQYSMDVEKYFNDIMAHFGFGKLNEAQRMELLKLISNVRAQVPGSIFYSVAVKQMADFMVKHSPKGYDFVDAWIELYYASMLSGVSTSLVNMGSVAVNEWTMGLQDLANISALISKVQKGAKTSPLSIKLIPAFVIRTLATFSGMREGAMKAADVYVNGSNANKYIDHLYGKQGLGVRELEKGKYGKDKTRRFYGKFNPLNLYKFFPRNLDAQDAFSTSIIESRYFAEMIRRKMIRGQIDAKNFNDLIDAVNGKGIDMKAIETDLQKEVDAFKKNTGTELSKNQINIRRNEMVRQAKQKALGLTKEEVEDVVRSASIAVFTGKRWGVMGHVAKALNSATSKYKGVRLFVMPVVPFVNIVGNVFDFMVDSTPGYGFARVYGYSLSGLVARARDYKEGKISLGTAFSPKYYNEFTAQAGDSDTLAREKQLGRAWFGTIAFTLLGMLFLPDADDDDSTDNYFRITGGRRTGDPANPPYTMWIGDTPIEYLNIPVLNIGLSILGNYSDESFKNARLSPEDRGSRLALSLMALGGTKNVIKDMSFMEGVQKLFDMIAEIIGEDEFEKEGVNTVDKTDKMGYVNKFLLEQYGGVLTKPLPQNVNLIRQFERIWDPTSVTKQDVDGVLLYNLGIERFAGDQPRSRDIFGRKTMSLPGDGMIAVSHYTGVVNKSADWQFLQKYGAEMKPPMNTAQEINGQARYFNAKEFEALLILSGRSFSEYCVQKADEASGFEETYSGHTMRRFNRVTSAQNEIWDTYSDKVSTARQTIKTWIESGTFDQNYKQLLKEEEQP